MIDSHCHLDEKETDVAGVMARARQADVTEMLAVACAVADFKPLLRLLDTYSNLYGAFGIHPENADELLEKEAFIKMISAHPRLVAVGECGLDYHYMAQEKSLQRSAFERQIEWASVVKKPLIIHAREADDDIITILDNASRAGSLKAGGVLHCFTGSRALAEKALEVGFYISASGVITFKSADAIRSVFRDVPLDHLLLETDSPYMAPVPLRGRPNEPAFMVHTAQKLAEIKGIEVSDLAKITTENFYRLFDIREKQNAS